ncbi:hypothetical protein LSTR_LSTR013255 [Laodelphax striatellus]|uniref:Uncharacterized protein n=1 Tax=Laodelphax striatellus TaxID=195883 RepID=A0A482WMX7_LAOST|nr:hypothetical protein LSTR_LSTR013255 [Laodelphax striatellus]
MSSSLRCTIIFAIALVVLCTLSQSGFAYPTFKGLRSYRVNHQLGYAAYNAAKLVQLPHHLAAANAIALKAALVHG